MRFVVTVSTLILFNTTVTVTAANQYQALLARLQRGYRRDAVWNVSYPLDDFRGDALYVDTTAFYLFLRAVTQTARTLFQNFERKAFGAYTSVLTFDELAYRMLLAGIYDTYPGAPFDHLRQRQEAMIEEF